MSPFLLLIDLLSMISNTEHICYLSYGGGRSFIHRTDTLATNIYDYKNHEILYNKMHLHF